MNNERLIAIVKELYPESGRHLIIKAPSSTAARDFVVSLSKSLSPQSPLPIFQINGAVHGDNGRAFRSIRAPAVIQMLPDGTQVTTRNRLAVPQEKPVIVFIDNFGFLSEGDQRAFSHLVDGEGGALSLAPGSMLVCAINKGAVGRIERGSLSRGKRFDLDDGPAGQRCAEPA